MKRKFIFLFMLATMCAISIPEAIAQYEVCSSCGGSGTIKKYSYVDNKYHNRTCSKCNGKGRVKSSGSGGDWKLYLNPEELQAVNFIEQAMREPYYVITPCTACNGTGKCPTCHGAGIVTLDSDGCYVCSGTGMCIGCRGVGSHSHVTENPNLENLRKQWVEYMKLGMERQRKQG